MRTLHRFAFIVLLGLIVSQRHCLAAAPRVPIIPLDGSAEQIGRQHGEKLGDQIRLLDEKYLKVFLGNETTRQAAIGAAAPFAAFISPDDRVEMNALAHSAEVDINELNLYECFLDLLPRTACSTVALPATASPDGIARMGRNLDFPSLDIADKHSVVLIYHRAGRYALASVAWPGMMGVLSGMNQWGLTLANMEVPRPAATSIRGMPYPLLYRMILERCRTVDEAITLLQITPRQTANNLMLLDAGGQSAVAEVTPEAVIIRRGTGHSALISTNHQRGQDTDTPGFCPRYDFLHDASANLFGRINRLAMETMLGRVAQGNLTIQSMVFEPSSRTIYLATGKDAPAQPYERIDLKPYFDAK